MFNIKVQEEVYNIRVNGYKQTSQNSKNTVSTMQTNTQVPGLDFMNGLKS